MFWSPLLFAIVVFTGIIAQLIRYRHHADSGEKQQTKWVIAGFAVANFGLFAITVLFSLNLSTSDNSLTLLIPALGLTTILIPLTISIALFRYRLWQIDIIINRTLVYGGLTAVILLIYGLVVGGFSLLWRSQNNLLISLLATGLIAVLFQPVRERLQRAVNKMTFGDRDDPAAVLARLSQRLEAVSQPEAVLPAIVETVAQALKLPYVAIVVGEAGEQGSGRAGEQIVAETGIHFDAPLQAFPLTYQSATIGQLQVAARSPNEVLSEADERVLRQVAWQAGTAVHASRLTHDLKQSRERIVTTREEERRRLRRDLHDGLGPSLASQTFVLDTALDLLESDPQAAAKLLQTLKAQNQSTVADIRRLVYALRPPALDDLGVVGALQAHVGQWGQGEMMVALTAVPNPLPPLSAAVEVAAYRITLEAVTNAIRHAHARRCTVTFTVQKAPTQLTIVVQDDGAGLPNNLQPGVGLRSMRERAEELGGRLQVENGEEGGVRITAVLPLAK
jgi:signal transduction histidine kinase